MKKWLLSSVLSSVLVCSVVFAETVRPGTFRYVNHSGKDIKVKARGPINVDGRPMTCNQTLCGVADDAEVMVPKSSLPVRFSYTDSEVADDGDPRKGNGNNVLIQLEARGPAKGPLKIRDRVLTLSPIQEGDE